MNAHFTAAWGSHRNSGLASSTFLIGFVIERDRRVPLSGCAVDQKWFVDKWRLALREKQAAFPDQYGDLEGRCAYPRSPASPTTSSAAGVDFFRAQLPSR